MRNCNGLKRWRLALPSVSSLSPLNKMMLTSKPLFRNRLNNTAGRTAKFAVLVGSGREKRTSAGSHSASMGSQTLVSVLSYFPHRQRLNAGLSFCNSTSKHCNVLSRSLVCWRRLLSPLLASKPLAAATRAASTPRHPGLHYPPPAKFFALMSEYPVAGEG